MSDPPRPPGRPRHHPDEVKDHPLAIRTTGSLKFALVRASMASGRSLTQEIEYRLWRSFEGYAYLDARNGLGIKLDVALEEFEQRLVGILAIVRENMSTARRDHFVTEADGDRGGQKEEPTSKSRRP